MRNLTIIALAAFVAPSLAFASAAGPATLARPAAGFEAPAAEPQPAEGKVLVAASQAVIPANGSLPEHVQPTARYIYVVSGRVRVSNLDTGHEQEIGSGEMAIEAEGQRHVAHALDGAPASVLLIEGAPSATDGV